MENNPFSEVMKLASQFASTITSLNNFLTEEQKNYTPEQKLAVEKALKASNYNEVLKGFDKATKNMGDALTDIISK